MWQEWKGIAQAHVDAFDVLKASDVNWTVLTPPTYFIEGPKVGTFRLGDDELVFGADGKASISYFDYAIAVVDEIEKRQYERKRFTLGY